MFVQGMLMDTIHPTVVSHLDMVDIQMETLCESKQHVAVSF